MAAIHLASPLRVRHARLIRAAELLALPISNNIVALVASRTGLDLYPLLAAALYTYVGVYHFKALTAEFRWSWRSVGWAASAGCALAIPTIIFLVHPLFVSSVQAGPGSSVTISAVNGLVRRLLVDLPVLTAIIEELVFRSYLLVKVGSLRQTVLANAALFTVWHIAVSWISTQGTAFGSQFGLQMLSFVGALGAVFIGGVVFTLVRLRTGSFVYSALTHWIAAGSIILALWGVQYLGW